jgi:hypothetical protein
VSTEDVRRHDNANHGRWGTTSASHGQRSSTPLFGCGS